MHRLGDVLEVHAFLHAGLRVGVDTIRALDRMSNGNADKRLFPLGEHTRRQRSSIPGQELLEQLRTVFAHLAEAVKIFRFVLISHFIHLATAFLFF